MVLVLHLGKRSDYYFLLQPLLYLLYITNPELCVHFVVSTKKNMRPTLIHVVISHTVIHQFLTLHIIMMQQKQILIFIPLFKWMDIVGLYFFLQVTNTVDHHKQIKSLNNSVKPCLPGSVQYTLFSMLRNI